MHPCWGIPSQKSIIRLPHFYPHVPMGLKFNPGSANLPEKSLIPASPFKIMRAFLEGGPEQAISD